MAKATPPAAAKELYRNCAHVSSQQRKYLWGGGHWGKLLGIKPKDGLDCSGSVSLVLDRTEMGTHDIFPGGVAITARAFRSWGHPGKGRWFTVWYNSEHVWIQFHGLGRFWRFDTSPWGSGGRGPRMRMTPRPTGKFNARHWPGL